MICLSREDAKKILGFVRKLNNEHQLSDEEEFKLYQILGKEIACRMKDNSEYRKEVMIQIVLPSLAMQGI